MRGELVSQAARIFSELLNSLRERLHFQTKLSRLQGCSTEHLRNVLRSVHYEKERQNARIRCEDDLIGEVALSGSLDKQMKQHLTHFSFEAVEMLQPQLTFRLERHYVNLGRLFASYFQSIQSKEHCQRLMATFSSASSAFKLEYYVGLLKLFFEHLRNRFSKAVKEATASILSQVKGDDQLDRANRSPCTQSRQDQYSMFSLIAPGAHQQQVYTGRSRSRRKKPSPNKLMFQSAAKGIEHIQQKLQQVNQVLEGSASQRYGPQSSFRLETNLDPITVQGSNRNLGVGGCSTPRNSVDRQHKMKRRRQLPITEDNSPLKYFPEAIKQANSMHSDLLPQPPFESGPLQLNKFEKKKRTLRRNNISEDNRKNFSVMVGMQKLPPLNQSPEVFHQLQVPNPEVKRYLKNPTNKRRYDQFMELYGSNMMGPIADAIPDLDVDYHRQRKKYMGIDKDVWIEENMQSVVAAILAENNETASSISRFSMEYYNCQSTKDTRISLSKLQTRRIQRPACRTLLVGGYNSFGQRDWRR